MGILLKYACGHCGYRTKELPLGLAPHPEEHDPRLVSCPSCKTLRVVDVREVAGGCRKHRCAFVVHDDERDVPCPKCGEAIVPEGTALWD
jgi:hypothetical protein